MREATKKERLRSNTSPSPFKMLWSKRKGREARERRTPFFHFLNVYLEKAIHSVAAACLPGGGTLVLFGGGGLRCWPSSLLIYLSLMMTRANLGATHGKGLRGRLLAAL